MKKSLSWAESLRPVDRLLFIEINRPRMKALMGRGHRGDEAAARQARILQRQISACRKLEKRK